MTSVIFAVLIHPKNANLLAISRLKFFVNLFSPTFSASKTIKYY